MKRFVSPFAITLTLIVVLVYAYLALRLTSGVLPRVALAVPLFLVWLVPALYWVGEREGHTRIDDWIHASSYISMGWLSFAVLLSVARDLVLLVTGFGAVETLHSYAQTEGAAAVLAGSVAALALGMLLALRGPGVVRVNVPIAGLPPALDGFRIAQISDLHVGPIIGARYVRRVVALAKAEHPDLYALTGDFVDGPVERLGPDLAALAELPRTAPAYFVTGNHEYYSGAPEWITHFGRLGIRVLQNESEALEVNGARLVIGGVNDPAVRRFDPGAAPDPQAAAGAGRGFRLLLAHNPKLAPLAAKAGFDLQLSGHTHAGQFFPWTLAVRLVHKPHVWGLSREGAMWVYISAGTGSWGPPVRFGTRPEISVIRLVAADAG